MTVLPDRPRKKLARPEEGAALLTATSAGALVFVYVTLSCKYSSFSWPVSLRKVRVRAFSSELESHARTVHVRSRDFVSTWLQSPPSFSPTHCSKYLVSAALVGDCSSSATTERTTLRAGPHCYRTIFLPQSVLHRF